MMISLRCKNVVYETFLIKPIFSIIRSVHVGIYCEDKIVFLYLIMAILTDF